MRVDEIPCWLGTARNDIIPEVAPLESAAKRRRLSRTKPPSRLTPPSSDRYDSLDMESPSKRRHVDDTPRAKRTQMSDHSYSLSEQSSQARSGRTSPVKQKQQLEDDPKGLKLDEFSEFVNMPTALRTFIQDVRAFTLGQGIVSASTADALADVRSHDSFYWLALQESSVYLTDDPSIAGCTPSPEDVLDIIAARVECSNKNHPEANWNVEVHQPILRMAFRPPGQKRFKQLVNFMGATTATILSQYGSQTASKKVDFCVYIEPKNDASLTDAYRSAADEMRRSLPGKVLNFTDFAPLYGRFVGLSIETKKPSENDETGQIQLGVWDMARWKFLRRLAAGLGEDEDIFAAASPETRAAREARLPEFLPGLVARGDEWYLVVTTQKAEKTVLWRKIPLGNTADTRGIYQIVRILQYLGRWVSDVYWPCVRRMLEEAQ